MSREQDGKAFERKALPHRSARPEAPATARAATNCRTCGTPIHFIKAPRDVHTYACDVARVAVVTTTGDLVPGYRLHRETCRTAAPRAPEPARAAAPDRAAPAPPPWVAPPAAPISPTPQLELRPVPPPDAAARARAVALARATITGWHNEAVQKVIVDAALSPEHQVRYATPTPDRYADDQSLERRNQRLDQERVTELLELTVPLKTVGGTTHIRLFWTAHKDAEGVLLQLRREVVDQYLRQREPGAEG